MFANRIWQAIKSILYDRTTPVQVVNSSYTTSASARPQVLSNGWIVVAESNFGVSPYDLKIHISKDNGATFQLLTTRAYLTGSVYFSISSYGTMVYLLVGYGVSSIVFDKFNAVGATEGNAINTFPNYSLASVDSSQTAFSGCSIAVNPTNGHLTASWSSKNATYPNSFNIRSAKSTDGGVTWTKQDGTAGVNQITTRNTTGQDEKEPCVVYDSTGKPHIINTFSNTGNVYVINNNRWNGSSWQTAINIYATGNYAQSSPTATVDSTGVIHVAWSLTSATYPLGSEKIAISKSTDNGATWSAVQIILDGQFNQLYAPSISANSADKLFIFSYGETPSSGGLQWGGLIEGTYGSWTTTVFNSRYIVPSSCDNFKNFEKPITIFRSITSTDVKFYGKWTVTP